MKINAVTLILFFLIGGALGFMAGRTTHPVTTALRRAKNLSAGDKEQKIEALKILKKQDEFIDLAITKAQVEETRRVITLSLGEMMAKHEMWNEAVKYLSIAYDILPGDFSVNLHLGMTYSSMYNLEQDPVKKREMYDLAIKHLKIALTANPENGDANYLMGLMLYQNGEKSESAKYLQNVLSRFPDDINSLLAMARIYYDWGDMENARKIYLKLENLLPADHPKMSIVQKNLQTLHEGLGND